MADLSPQRWWHGGVPGLRPGDLLLPPGRTGMVTSLQVLHVMSGVDVRATGELEADRWRADRVYLTRDREHARVKAAAWYWAKRGLFAGRQDGERGALYEAEPVSCLWTPDPDCPADTIEGLAARVLRVVDPAVWMDYPRFESHLNRYVKLDPALSALQPRRGTRRDMSRIGTPGAMNWGAR